jgi:hypothetical protein
VIAPGAARRSIDVERNFSKCPGSIEQIIQCDPPTDSINSSDEERHFKRLMNIFSKKFENHGHTLALIFVSNKMRAENLRRRARF